MARMARVEVFAPDEVAIVHVMNRVVRRCFLLGNDPVTGKNYDHRKVWVETLLKRFSAHFGIDLLGFAILSNHFHLILRSRPDVVTTWDDTEVARRWLMLCPMRKDAEENPEIPDEMELDTVRNDPEKMKTVRLRLSDIGWWMRLLCQQIAIKANREDQEMGKFWQSRFKAVRLLDEAALLACSAYVDLNPIRAAMAQTLEQSDFTSVQRRIQTMQAQSGKTIKTQAKRISTSASSRSQKAEPVANGSSRSTRASASSTADGFLAPLTLDERSGKTGTVANRSGLRCSDKGFLPMSQGDYLQLLDWTARQLVEGKPGATPAGTLPIIERLSLDPKVWCDLVAGFGRLFYNVAGQPQTIDATPSRVTQQRYYLRGETRKLFVSTSPESSA